MRRQHRETVTQLAILAASPILFAALWLLWQPGGLARPESNYPFEFAAGLADAPPDTRVFLSFYPWSERANMSLRLVLGQSKAEPSRVFGFRIEFPPPIAELDPAACQSNATAHTCWQTSDGLGGLVETEEDRTVVLTGTLTSTEGMYIDMRPLRGPARNGPYRSFFAEIAPFTGGAGSGFAYPSRGVEIEVGTGVGSSGVRYEGFFPVQPYRLYPDGWAWLVPAPGGPVGMQITDTGAEDGLRRTSEVAGLLMGIVLAFAAQVAYELLKSRRTSP